MVTVDYSDILSDIAQLLSEGVPLEVVIEDAWYSIQAEIELLHDGLHKQVVEVIMSGKIEFDNNPEPTTSLPLQIF